VRRVRITACDNKPRLHGETFAPTVRTKSVRWLLGDVAASMVGGRRRKRLHQVDIEAAYLNAEVKGTIYVRPLPEFGVGPGKVWMLKKALYGTKEAANLWNGDLHNTLLDLGMVQSTADKCLYLLERLEGMWTTFFFRRTTRPCGGSSRARCVGLTTSRRARRTTCSIVA